MDYVEDRNQLEESLDAKGDDELEAYRASTEVALQGGKISANLLFCI